MMMNDFLQKLNETNRNTVMETLGIRYIEFTGDTLTAEMEVTPKTHQPMGLMHGGVNAVLAETVGSYLSILQFKKEEKKSAVGINIQVNHMRAVRKGKVFATASFLRKGQSLHFMQILIKDEAGHITAQATMTNKIIDVK
uniref:PaaI family thioesterase n=1 Tax=Ornithobacterium rhinotracheale TaxID=28251 RepID=UPI0039A5EDA0